MPKSIVLMGGTGSRMAPATSFVNKHLLPVYSGQGAVPMLYYPIDTLVKTGSKEILVISSREHCGRIIEHLGDGSQWGADFTYKIQDTTRVPMGIASALKLAEDFTRDEPFLVILGDNFFENSFANELENISKSKVKAGIFLKEVEDPKRFGVYADGEIQEKPKRPKSNLAVTGLYWYTSHVYEIAKKLQVSARGELEISDINQYYCRNKEVNVNHVRGFWSDMGTPLSLQKTQEFIQKKNYRLKST